MQNTETLQNERYRPSSEIRNSSLLWSACYSRNASIHTAFPHKRWPGL